VLEPHVGQRVLFAECAGAGLAAIEAAPRSEAAREIEALVASIETGEERQAA
jgi:chromosome partitioning protein